MLSINQLHREIEDRMEKKKNVYSKILDKCYQRIIITNKKNNNCYCFFSCPTFIFGVPLYNITNCVIYIMEDLSSKGFQVQYTHPNLLYISWFKRSNSIEYKKQSKPVKEKEEFKKIDSFKPKNDFLYDIDSMNFLNKKKDNLFNL